MAKALANIDPINSQIRWTSLIRRRKYKVPGPNSLWHCDGHHSLICWGFVIHGAIEGFSRYIVYLNCSTNNKKDTALDLFEQAVLEMGTPSRIRTDEGGENLLIWDLMMSLRGPYKGSFIAASSLHNQRIEQLWRDMWNCISCQFYYTFQAMEDQGLYNSNCLIIV